MLYTEDRMKHVEEKLKNDFQKPNFIPYTHVPVERERGTALTVFLIFIMAVNVFFLFSYCAQVNQVRSSDLPLVGLAFATQCGILACVVGVWNWQKWGYNGMVAAYGLNIFLSVTSGSITTLMGSIVGLVLLMALVNDKLEMFD